MSTAFENDPSVPNRRIWRRSSWRAVGSGFGAVLLGPLTLFMLVASVLGARMPGGLPTSLFLLDGSSMTLRLPGGRSLIHNPPRCRETVPFSDVEAVETRLEAYGAQGMGMMQRAYRLRRRNGPPIFLFEERALSTRLADHSLHEVATEIASRTGMPLDDLGMVQGQGGILGAWFTKAPDWSATSLPAAKQSRLWWRVTLTGVLASIAVAAIWPLSAIL